MTTDKRNATANGSSQTPDLMGQVSISTANLGWLQDYLSDWQLLRSLAVRIARKQGLQPRKDEQAYALLTEAIGFANDKIGVLEAAYTAAYERHERLMIRLQNEIEGI